MSQVLKITDWGKHFECSQSRNLKAMTWVPIRVNLAGDGYTELLNHPNGAAHFGGWIGLVEVAALCQPRGTLRRGNGKPHDAESLSRITRIPVDILAEAIPRLLNIGWLERETVASQQDDGAILQDTVAPQRSFVATDITDSTDKTETPCSSGDERGAGGLELVAPKPKPPDEVLAWFDAEFWPVYPRKVGKPQALKAARRHGRTATARAAILECLKRRLPALQEQFRADGDFRPYPATWLNQTPWMDPEEVAQPAARKAFGGDVVSSGIAAAMQILTKQEKQA
jgi:hypothetical protein